MYSTLTASVSISVRSVMVTAQVSRSCSRGFDPRRMHLFFNRLLNFFLCMKKLKVKVGLEPTTYQLRSAEDATALTALMTYIA